MITRNLQAIVHVLVNLEWGFGANPFDWILNRSMIFLLADAGYAYTGAVAITDGWNGIAIPNMKTDMGICYGTANGGFRIGAVWRNDIGKAALLLRSLARFECILHATIHCSQSCSPRARDDARVFDDY